MNENIACDCHSDFPPALPVAGYTHRNQNISLYEAFMWPPDYDIAETLALVVARWWQLCAHYLHGGWQLQSPTYQGHWGQYPHCPALSNKNIGSCGTWGGRWCHSWAWHPSNWSHCYRKSGEKIFLLETFRLGHQIWESWTFCGPSENRYTETLLCDYCFSLLYQGRCGLGNSDNTPRNSISVG